MSHITRRKFLTSSAAVVGSAALAPIASALPLEAPTPAVAAEPLSASAYEELAQALVKPILREIREASVMRQIITIEKVRARQENLW